MDPSHYSESRYPAYNGHGSLQVPTTDFTFGPLQSFDQYPHNLVSHHVSAYYPSGLLSTRHTTPYNPAGIFPVQDDWHQLPAEHDPLISDRHSPIGIFSVQPQHVHLSYAEKAVQTTQSDPTSKGNKVQERPQARQRPTPRELVSQETYKNTQHPAGFAGSNVIEFVVNGEEGICLSDASEGDWVGFEGGEDRSLFKGDRLQIMVAGCSPWHSKIPTTDFTAKHRPITRRKLAADVAKSVKKFIAREKLNGHDGGHPRCGWGDVSLENVFLTRMVRVSAASWQPEIFVERPSITSQEAASTSSSPNPLA